MKEGLEAALREMLDCEAAFPAACPEPFEGSPARAFLARFGVFADVKFP